MSCTNSDKVLQYNFFSFLLFTCNYLEILADIYCFKSLYALLPTTFFSIKIREEPSFG